MLHHQVSPPTAAAARDCIDRIDRLASQLAVAYAKAKADATRRAARHPNLISAFALSDLIEELKDDQVAHGNSGELAESITLNRTIARLSRLLPNF